MQLVELPEQYIYFIVYLLKKSYPNSTLSKKYGGDMEEKCRKFTRVHQQMHLVVLILLFGCKTVSQEGMRSFPSENLCRPLQ